LGGKKKKADSLFPKKEEQHQGPRRDWSDIPESLKKGRKGGGNIARRSEKGKKRRLIAERQA